jgi:hypothetical protein
LDLPDRVPGGDGLNLGERSDDAEVHGLMLRERDRGVKTVSSRHRLT